MIITDYKNIDYSKYKRVFAFGCSFTNYAWPTWADILVKEMPNVQYFNMGTSGAGNQYITHKLMENNLFNTFTDTDLILVMYSTHCREDRYVNNRWETPGNIYTCDYYPEEFTKKYSDPKGYLLRDITLIEYNSVYLESLPCDSIQLLSVPWDYQTVDIDVSNIIELHNKTTKRFDRSLYQLNNNGFKCGHWYYWDAQSKTEKFGDYHPNTRMYCDYLLKMGFNLSESTIDYSDEVTNVLNTCETRMELEMTAKARFIPTRTEGLGL